MNKLLLNYSKIYTVQSVLMLTVKRPQLVSYTCTCFFRVSVSCWTFQWKGKGVLLQRLVLLPELPSGQLLSDPCTPVAQLGYQQAQGSKQTALLSRSSISVKGVTSLFVPICSLRYQNKPRSSWNLCMRSPCWMCSSSTHVCMNIASLSVPSCVSVSSFSRCGLTCSAVEPLLPKTSDEGRLVVTERVEILW